MVTERASGSAVASQFQLAVMRFFGEKVPSDQADKYASKWIKTQKKLFEKLGDSKYRQVMEAIYDMDRKRIPYPTPMSLLERHLQIRFK